MEYTYNAGAGNPRSADTQSEAKVSESCQAKKDKSLRKVKIYESLLADDDWDAHTSNVCGV